MSGTLYAASFDGIPSAAYGGPYPIDCSRDTPRICDIFLEDSGPNKMAVIKLLRTYHLSSDYNYGCMTAKYYSDRPWYNKEFTLKEAKAFAYKPLSLIYEDVYMNDARRIKEEFEKLGAKIHIVVTSWDPYMGR